MSQIAASELVLNPDGSVYHLALHEEHVKDYVLLVGDPGRVDLITSMMDKVTAQAHNREFYTKVASYNGMQITVMSTGIGTDNIDIAINELDAAVNIDLKNRSIKSEKRSLNLIRLGTSGALQEDIPVDSLVASKFGLGFDGLMNYYQWKPTKEEISLRDAFIHHMAYPMDLAKPYIVESNQDLRLKISAAYESGITATASGFYAPQGRVLRIPLAHQDLNENLSSFEWNKERITNYEMETSALYGLSRALGHNACTVCAIIANRKRGEYSKDYKTTVKRMIAEVLERLTAH
jgi:uridine phosphorylase